MIELPQLENKDVWKEESKLERGFFEKEVEKICFKNHPTSFKSQNASLYP
jgi:hypothetical protein